MSDKDQRGQTKKMGAKKWRRDQRRQKARAVSKDMPRGPRKGAGRRGPIPAVARATIRAVKENDTKHKAAARVRGSQMWVAGVFFCPSHNGCCRPKDRKEMATFSIYQHPLRRGRWKNAGYECAVFREFRKDLISKARPAGRSGYNK